MSRSGTAWQVARERVRMRLGRSLDASRMWAFEHFNPPVFWRGDDVCAVAELMTMWPHASGEGEAFVSDPHRFSPCARGGPEKFGDDLERYAW